MKSLNSWFWQSLDFTFYLTLLRFCQKCPQHDQRGFRLLEEGVRWHLPPGKFEISSPRKGDFRNSETKSAVLISHFLKMVVTWF